VAAAAAAAVNAFTAFVPVFSNVVAVLGEADGEQRQEAERRNPAQQERCVVDDDPLFPALQNLRTGVVPLLQC